MRLITNLVSFQLRYLFGQEKMVEALLSGIVSGLIPITLAGLFVTAYLQYRRGDQLDLRSNIKFYLPFFIGLPKKDREV
nr:cytochrome b6/f complex subunit V [Takakia lepidozioides]